MTPDDAGSPDPRTLAQQRLEEMVGRGELTLADFSDRAAKIWAATCPAELEVALSGLPDTVRSAAPSCPPSSAVTVEGGRSTRQWTVLGDLKREGRWDLTEGFSATAILGDVVLDLREAVVDAPRTRIEILSVGGDVKILVPPGVTVHISGTRLLGDLKVDQGAHAGSGGPHIELHVEGVLGDLKVKYLPAGEKVPLTWRWF